MVPVSETNNSHGFKKNVIRSKTRDKKETGRWNRIFLVPVIGSNVINIALLSSTSSNGYHPTDIIQRTEEKSPKPRSSCCSGMMKFGNTKSSMLEGHLVSPEQKFVCFSPAHANRKHLNYICTISSEKKTAAVHENNIRSKLALKRMPVQFSQCMGLCSFRRRVVSKKKALNWLLFNRSNHHCSTSSWVFGSALNLKSCLT